MLVRGIELEWCGMEPSNERPVVAAVVTVVAVAVSWRNRYRGAS